METPKLNIYLQLGQTTKHNDQNIMIKISKALLAKELKKVIQFSSVYQLRTIRRTSSSQENRYSEKAVDPSRFTE